MAKQRGADNIGLDSAAARTIAAHESSIKTLKRELETAPNQTPDSRRHLYYMIAKHYELLAKEYRALAKEHG